MVCFIPISLTVNVYCFHPKKIETGQHSKCQSSTSTLSHIRKYCAKLVIIMTAKYGLLTFIAIMTKEKNYIMLLVVTGRMMIKSSLTRVMRINLAKQ